MTTLIFVYNADSGLFNTMADIGHKIFSPSTYKCDLCSLTHGVFSERKEWHAFVDNLDIETRFLHRDEFIQEYPSIKDKLPAIFIQHDADLKLCIDSKTLHECKELDQLQNLIALACKED